MAAASEAAMPSTTLTAAKIAVFAAAVTKIGSGAKMRA